MPLKVPLVTPLTPLRVMSLALNPAMAWLKVSVNCVVAAEVEPLAVTLFNVTEGRVTVTLQAAVLLPSTVVAVIVAVPAETAVTTPPAETVALALLQLLHVTFWLVALEGAIVGRRVSVSPTVRLADDLFSETPVTGTLSSVTLTVQVAVLPPSAVVTVMVTVPAETELILPLDDTVAILVLPLRHVTFWFVALEGTIIEVRVSVSSTRMLVDDLLRETLVTGMLIGGVGVLSLVGTGPGSEPDPPPPQLVKTKPAGKTSIKTRAKTIKKPKNTFFAFILHLLLSK